MNLSKGQVAAVLGGLATIATAFGFERYATVLNDPTTAIIATTIVGVVSSFVAGHLPGAKPAAPAAPAA